MAATVGSDCSPGIVSGGYDIVGDPSAGAIAGNSAGLTVGVSGGLLALASNGGPTPTHMPSASSLCVDHGDPTGCKEQMGTPVAVDQRGSARPVDFDGDGIAICDIGAVERDCGPDSDGDTVGDACDCAAADPTATRVPPPADLRVVRDGATGDPLVTWLDLAPLAGSATAFDVASDAIGTSWAHRRADAPCVAIALAPAVWRDTRFITSIGWYYLVRGVNPCGPARGAGWGTDSRGTPRPACP